MNSIALDFWIWCIESVNHCSCRSRSDSETNSWRLAEHFGKKACQEVGDATVRGTGRVVLFISTQLNNLTIAPTTQYGVRRARVTHLEEVCDVLKEYLAVV